MNNKELIIRKADNGFILYHREGVTTAINDINARYKRPEDFYLESTKDLYYLESKNFPHLELEEVIEERDVPPEQQTRYRDVREFLAMRLLVRIAEHFGLAVISHDRKLEVIFNVIGEDSLHDSVSDYCYLNQNGGENDGKK